jgi:hypothetical protein
MLAQAGLEGDTPGQEPGDYPQEYLEEVARLANWVKSLADRFGGCVTVRIHDPRSPRAMWKALRHGVHRYPSFVIDGKRCISGWQPERLEEQVAQAILHPGSRPESRFNRWLAPIRRLTMALGQMVYGMTIYEMVRDLHKERGSLERMFVLITFGDLLGVPILPPYYTLRLLPYVIPNINAWKHSLLRERDLTDLCDQEIT